MSHAIALPKKRVSVSMALARRAVLHLVAAFLVEIGAPPG
jgi:HAMP domain-containing protein